VEIEDELFEFLITGNVSSILLQVIQYFRKLSTEKGFQSFWTEVVNIRSVLIDGALAELNGVCIRY
jgi:hypothetical protein